MPRSTPEEQEVKLTLIVYLLAPLLSPDTRSPSYLGRPGSPLPAFADQSTGGCEHVGGSRVGNSKTHERGTQRCESATWTGG